MNIIIDLQQLRFLSLAASPCAGPMLGLNCLVIYGMSGPLALKKGPVPKSGRGPQKNRKFDQKTYFPNHDIGEFTASLDESTSSCVLLISHDIPVAPKNKWDVMDTIWDVYIYIDIMIYIYRYIMIYI